jgi:hemerythrin
MQNLYIIWKYDYNLGIPIIDEQHRTIVSIINSYHYFCSNRIEKSILKPTFITLQQYTKIHFLTEENILSKTNYPEEQNHIKLHTSLKQKMIDIARETISTNDSDIVLNFLKKWWLNHIRIEDMKYSSHVKEEFRIK